MSQTITLTVPHRLSQDDARQRIQNGLADFRRDRAAQVAHLEDHWTGNHLDARCSVLGQTITARADVEPDRVVIHVDLPWLLAKLVNIIRPQLQDKTTRLLSR